jgi:hypothetical protein
LKSSRPVADSDIQPERPVDYDCCAYRKLRAVGIWLRIEACPSSARERRWTLRFCAAPADHRTALKQSSAISSRVSNKIAPWTVPLRKNFNGWYNLKRKQTTEDA